MNAAFVLEAIRAAHRDAAIVHEVVIGDHLWDERRADTKPTRRIDALMFSSFQRTAIVNRFVYVVPKALYEQVGGNFGTYDLDVWDCGVWTVDEDGKVAVVKKAKVRPHPEPLPQQVVQALAYRAAKHPATPGENR